MAGDPRVHKLLEEMLESGSTPEEVCRECPKLLPQVRYRWRRMRSVEAQFDVLFPGARDTQIPGMASQLRSAAELPHIPGYEVEALLGRGGMGVVFLARHLRLNRLVALKMALAGAFARPKDCERFQREAQAVAGLRHPNIVQIHDIGDLDGQPYFTMEYIEGGSLARKLAGNPQPAREAAALLATLARAVHAAHQGGIVHRDLKPANVLLTSDDTPKISDFGLARRLDGEAGLTQTGTTIGTPSYMAPEQAAGQSLAAGHAVDIYALGAILYELLTGRPPFRAETAAETVQQVISQDPAPPTRLNARVPRDLETVCLKCLHKEPKLRYASAAALAEDIDRFLGGEPIAARPDGQMARLFRRVRRRPVLSAALAAVTLFTVALVGGGLWLISDRAAAGRVAKADQAATERAAEEDLRDMAQWLRKSSWPEARAALERAKGRLGDRGSTESRRLLDQGARELDLAARLESIRMDLGRDVREFLLGRPDEKYDEAFRGAGLGTVHDDPKVVADRVRTSNIQNALVAALDHWSAYARDPRRRGWVLEVARRADIDPTGWRDRARDPIMRADAATLGELIKTAPVADEFVPLFLALDKQLKSDSKERLPFLKRVHQAHPGDFWVNLTLGDVLMYRENSPGEAIRYCQAAVAIRPHTALSHNNLGFALLLDGRIEEAIEQYRAAADLDPTFAQTHHAIALLWLRLGRYDEAIDQLQEAIRLNPNVASLRATLGQSLAIKGRLAEALSHYRQAVALDPKDANARSGLRNTLVRLGMADEARVVWQTALDANPPDHADWYGYAEFCLFTGQEEEYRRARQALLSRFGATTDTFVAERTARACLLLPGSEDEMRQAVALAERAVGADPSKHQGTYAYLLFARGLAEYRQGRLDQAITTMRGDAAGALGPAPRLVLAMALHRSGREAEARKTLAAATAAHDWRANQVADQNDWICHVLRREAEAMILPNLPAFLDGKYRPQDNDERLALIGVCQFTNRTLALARLYADAFASAPELAEDVRVGHRFSAARVAAQAGCGRGVDATSLGEAEERRWRDQARQWLRAELAAWSKVPDGDPAVRLKKLEMLMNWRADPDLSSLRAPAELEKLPANEREDCLALWNEFSVLLKRAWRGHQ